MTRRVALATFVLVAAAHARGVARETERTMPAVVLRPATVDPGGIALVLIDDPSVGVARISGELRGRPLAFFTGGDGRARALAGIDLAAPPGDYRVMVAIHPAPGAGAGKGSQPVSAVLHVRSKVFPREDLTVEQKYVEPDKATLARIAREQAALDAVVGAHSPERLWRGSFLLPADGPAGSPFGLRRFFNRQERRPHAGQDVRVPEGTPVVAAQAGRVVLARAHFFTGNTIVLDHGLGLFTLYFHLAEFRVREGTRVDRGTLLGYSGRTGRVTGPHLHWAALLDGARVDPMLLLDDLAAEHTEDHHGGT